ncbi:MAG: KH domain-containing protein [archaeon]|mgnify:CR=1 FL=1|jgi:ribosomal RNA assembly protein|nr:RNA-processing protein [Euryarchaeota archaeon]MDP6704060.1 KH domain-containing protein [archaeon]MDP7260834.1 KH domain-containing protein [archaeon]HIK01384.1 RNA-processing protein [Candidatus Undinarchaeales archaeon ERR594346 U_76725]|tara:strand:+ start:5653 stop:6198 length:546 start_codon:yes stop_codon:yes gene_type:complete
MAEYVKIPKERLKLLLEEDGKLIKYIESQSDTKIRIDKLEQEISIESSGKSDEILDLWRARDTIKAIGRGAEPEAAIDILESDAELQIVDLSEFVGKKHNALVRIKGRVIGTKGKAKNIIENLTNTQIFVYGKTVTIIGEHDMAVIAKGAVELLARGTMHSTAIHHIETELSKLGVKYKDA